MFKHIKVENGAVSWPKTSLREINRGGWSTGLLRSITGAPQSSHERTSKDFDLDNVAAPKRGAGGRYLRLAVAMLGHAGIQASMALAVTLQHEPAGEGRWRHVPRRVSGSSAVSARECRSDMSRWLPYSEDSEIKDGYPEFTLGRPQEAWVGQGPHRRGVDGNTSG